MTADDRMFIALLVFIVMYTFVLVFGGWSKR